MERSYESSMRRNGAARGALKSSAEDVLEDLIELRKDAARLAKAANIAARSEASHASARIKRLRRDVRTNAKRSVDFMGTQVRDKPAQALGIAIGVGFLLGLTLPRRH